MCYKQRKILLSLSLGIPSEAFAMTVRRSKARRDTTYKKRESSWQKCSLGKQKESIIEFIHSIAKRILERLGIQTSSLFVKI